MRDGIPDGGYNLPPGCTCADIDRAMGSDDPYQDDCPYVVDRLGDTYFGQESFYLRKPAEQRAIEVGGVVLDATKLPEVVILFDGTCI